MPILIHRAFSEVTPESAEYGDHSETGLIADNESCTFGELVRYLKSHPHPSCYPARGETYEWFSADSYTSDYSTGTEREETIHYSRDNPERMAKYWRKAAILAGIVKGADE